MLETVTPQLSVTARWTFVGFALALAPFAFSRGQSAEAPAAEVVSDTRADALAVAAEPKAEAKPDGRPNASAKRPLLEQRPMLLSYFPLPVSDVDVSPDGNRLAVASQQGGKKDDSAERPLAGEPTPSFRGKIVLFGSRAADRNAALIQTMRVDGTEVRTVAEFENANILPGRVSPDGRRVAFNLARRQKAKLQACVMDANGEYEVLAEDVVVVAWMPDGKRIACYRGDRGHWNSLAIDIDTKKTQRLPMAGTDVVHDVSPDGEELLVMSRPADKFFKHPTLGIYRKRQIYRMPTDGTQRVRLTDPETDNIWSRFSPDGRRIAFYHRSYETGEPVESGRVMDLKGRNVKQVVDFTQLGLRAHYAPCWATDGKRIIWPANTVPDPQGSFDVELIVTSFDGAPTMRLKSNDAAITRWGFPDCR